MAEGQQIHRHEQARGEGAVASSSGRSDEAHRSLFDNEADVVAAHDMIEAGRSNHTARGGNASRPGCTAGMQTDAVVFTRRRRH